MTIQSAKEMMDAFYTGKRIVEQLPALPRGVTSSFIHVLDTMVNLRSEGQPVRVSDISDRLGLARPGVTRTVKQMEQKGYLEKEKDPEDARVVHLKLTAAGEELYRQYVEDYFHEITDELSGVSDEEITEMAGIVRKIDHCYKAGGRGKGGRK